MLQIRDEFDKESQELKGKLLKDQQVHREKIKERLQQKRRTNELGGGMGSIKTRIKVQSMRVVDFTSDDED